MKQQWKTVLLVVAALIVLALIALLSVRIYHSAQGFHLPGPEDRHMGERDMHSWMTVEEVASKYKTTPEAVFAAFSISPEAGDEKLTLRSLKDKYGKSREEMQKGLETIINSAGPPPGEPPDQNGNGSSQEPADQNSPGQSDKDPGKDSGNQPPPANDKGNYSGNGNGYGNGPFDGSRLVDASGEADS